MYSIIDENDIKVLEIIKVKMKKEINDILSEMDMVIDLLSFSQYEDSITLRTRFERLKIECEFKVKRIKMFEEIIRTLK